MGHKNRVIVSVLAFIATSGYLLLVAIDADAARTVGVGLAAVLSAVSLVWDYLERNGDTR